jgi:hypothetical protein
MVISQGVGDMTDYIGRVVGESTDTILVRCTYDTDVWLGDMLVVEDIENGIRYLLRVVEIKHGADSLDPSWFSRTAGSMIFMDRAGERFEMHEKERRLYKLTICTPLGTIGETFRKSKTIPHHFSKVYKPREEDLDFLNEYMGDLEIGAIRSGSSSELRVKIDGNSFPHHIGIFATTGMGKSNFMKVLAKASMESGRYGLLIFDPHGEYYDGGSRGKLGLKEVGDLLYFSSRPRSGGSMISIRADEITVSDLMELFTFSDAQIESIYLTRAVYGEDYLKKIEEKELDELREDLGNRVHETTLNVLKRRLEVIFRSDVISDLSMTNSIIDALGMGMVVVVDTAGLGYLEENLVMNLITRRVYESHRRTYRDRGRFEKLNPTAIVIEEAQRLLSKESSIFSTIAREGRKFKLGLCAISQQPKLIDPQLLSQFNTLIILGLADQRDRDILMSSSKQDISKMGGEIQSLMPGEGIITSPYAPFAISVQIHEFEKITQKRRRAKREGLDEDFY